MVGIVISSPGWNVPYTFPEKEAPVTAPLVTVKAIVLLVPLGSTTVTFPAVKLDPPLVIPKKLSLPER